METPLNNGRLRAVARCSRCRQVLIDEEIDAGTEKEFRTRANKMHHGCKNVGYGGLVRRVFVFDPVGPRN